MVKLSTKFELNRTICGLIKTLANFWPSLRHAKTLTFDSLTLNFCSTSTMSRVHTLYKI